MKLIYLIALSISFSSVVFAKDVAIVLGSDISTFESTASTIKGFLAKNGHPDCDLISASKDADYVSTVKNGNYNIVCVLGSNPFKKVKDAVSIPVIFSMVLDPLENGVVSTLGPSGSNYSGVSLDVPASTQFDLLHKVMSSVRKIGVIYGPKSARFVDEAKADQGKQGFEIVSARVESTTDVPGALRSLPEVDVLWVIPDAKVCTKDSLPFIFNFSSDKKIPVFAFADYLVKAGALFCYTYDYGDIGVQTGELVLRILNGDDPGKIAITGPRKLGYSINTRIAKYLGIDLPSSILSGADQKFD